jgi:hypothetical protein
VNTASAINTQNNTDESRTPDGSRCSGTDNNTNNNTNNTSNNSDDDLSTNYVYKVMWSDVSYNIVQPPEILDNFAGPYILIDMFIDMILGKFNPPHIRTKHWYNFFSWLGECILYGLYCIYYAISCVLLFVAWVVYSVGWLIVSVIWSIYYLVMQIVIFFMSNAIKESINNLANQTANYKYNSTNRTAIDPEKVMGKFYNNIFHNTSGENNSSILGDGLLFYPVDPLNINPNINNSNNVIITNNDIVMDDTNKTNDTVVYDVYNSIIGSDIPDENGNINCTNVTNSTNCINSNNIINSDNVVNSNYVSNSNGIANSSNIINSINVTNSSNVTNSNTIIGSNNIIKSNIISSSNDINDSNNLNGINNSINLNNSVNSINLKDSDNLINCNNITNSSNSIGCNDSALLINCINSRNATNCSNSTYVFDMENRTNEYRKPDGYLHVLSTEYCKDGNGSFNPNKIKVNDNYPIDSTVVDKDGNIAFFTATDDDLTSFYENLGEQIKILNNSINTLEKTKKNSETATISVGIASVIALIVGIIFAAVTEGGSETVADEDLGESVTTKTTNGIIKKVTQTTTLEIMTTEGGIMSSTSPVVTLWGRTLIANLPLILGGSGFLIFGVAAVGLGLGWLKGVVNDLNTHDSERTYEEDVLITSVLEKMFRLENKIIVD